MFARNQSPRSINQMVFHDESKNLIVLGRELPTPFKILNAHLYTGYASNYGLGSPSEAFEHLFVLHQGRVTRVVDLSSLRGWVRLETPGDALAFVRLPTALATFHLFNHDDKDRPSLDIIDASKREKQTFGSRGFDVGQVSDGMFCIVSHARYRVLGLPEVTVSKVAGTFLVERPVVNFGPSRRNGIEAKRVLLWRQYVRPDGNIIDQEKRELPQKIVTSLPWSMPMYE